MKFWQVIAICSPFLAAGAYVSYRFSANAPELASVENALGNANLISTRIVPDRDYWDSALPVVDIQKIYVVPMNRFELKSHLAKALSHSVWKEGEWGGNGYIASNEKRYFGTTEPYFGVVGAKGEWLGTIVMADGKHSSELAFGESPKKDDPGFTTVYIELTKDDPISLALASIKVK